MDVTTLGEMWLRLSVPSGECLENAHKLDIHPAGAEANVVTLSFDINYRQKLRQQILPLIQNVELLLCSPADAQRLFARTGSMQAMLSPRA